MGDVTKRAPPTGAAVPTYSRPDPISADHDAGDFSCGHESLDDWLRSTALKAEGKTARTYTVREGARIVGYYCLAMGAAARDDIPKNLRRNTPNEVPIAIIGRLAVAKHHQGRGIGSGMLQDALRRIIQLARSAGCLAVLVHAIDDAACTFYMKYGFVEFPGGTRTMFLPVATLEAALLTE